MICEWCKSTYPPSGMKFHYVSVFMETHIICDDCYSHLAEVDPLTCDPCQPTSPECDKCTRKINYLVKPDCSKGE